MPPASRDIIADAISPSPFAERRACKGCRSIKSRCMIRPGSNCCSRCLRLQLECAFPVHHRGVKNGKRKKEVIDQDQDQVKQYEHDEQQQQQYQHEQQQQQARANPFSIQSLLATDSSLESTLLSSTAFATIQMDPRKSSLPTPTNLVLPIKSIVAAKLFTEQQASQLIEFYYKHLNPIVALLDRQIYTCQALLLRPDYHLLLASICTVSAKFCISKQYQQCLDFLQPTLALVAAGDIPPQLETIQSLSLLAMWKHPKDGVSWRKLRLAVTLAFELGLHYSFKQGEGDERTREGIQAQRTFMQLACFEDGYKDQCRMPLSIDSSYLPEPWKWIESLGEMVQDIDIRLAASRENALVKQELIRNLAESDDQMTKASCLRRIGLINTAIATQESNVRIWKDPTAYGLSCQHSGRPCLLFHNTNTLFNYYRALYSVYCCPALAAHQEQRQSTFQRCCQLSIELFELLNGPYGDHDYYRFVHDIVILNLAVAAVWISDNWQVMPVSLARQAISAVCTAANITASSFDCKLEQASYLARFLTFCTTKFSSFVPSEVQSSHHTTIYSSTTPEMMTNQQQWADAEQELEPSPPGQTYMQSEATRYLEEVLATSFFPTDKDALDINSILSFFAAEPSTI